MIEILTQGGYHELTIPDCMELFNAWLEADYEQQGNLYDLVDKLSDKIEVEKLAGSSFRGPLFGPYYAMYRAFLAGFFLGQSDGVDRIFEGDDE